MKYKMKRLFFLFSFVLIIGQVNAQFQLNGSTTDLGGGEYEMTPAVNTTSGSLWYKVQHDLDAPFNVQGQLYFGLDDAGADGIVFVMQTSCLTAGGGGGGLGFSGIPGQSLGIEFDTYRNVNNIIDGTTGSEDNFDPVYDHIVVEKNGDVVHDGSPDDITTPIQIDALSPNVETGTYYDFQINYNPITKVLLVVFNGSVRINMVYDLKVNVFPGKQYVYWGFTSTTGGFNNQQKVILNETITTHAVNDTTLCTGSVPVTLPSLVSLRGTNLAVATPAFSSSNNGGGTPATAATDGNMGTRWESIHNVDPQWIYVDLISPTDIDSVVLYWEAARAKDYLLQTSTDAVSWNTVFSTTTGSGPKDKIIFSATNVRYIRMYGTARLIGYGYSIWEFQVYGLPKYQWSTNNGTNATISPDLYSNSVVVTPAVTTTYSVVIPDPCVNYVTLNFTVTISCPAPVTLIDFTAEPKTNGVLLQWITASEKNTNYFEVLKSTDGINFYSIGTVNAAGNSSSLQTYTYFDNSPVSEMVYYKIVSVDFDGSKQESEIETVRNDLQKAIVLSPVFEGETSLILSGKVDQLTYAIIDMMGREVAVVSMQNPPSIIAIGQDLAPACYLLRINNNNQTETLKMCKVK